MAKVIVQRNTDKPLIYGRTVVTCKKCGNIIESIYMTNRNDRQRIKKLNKDEYEVIATGEIKEFEHKENRSEDLGSVRSSLRRLRDYINTNVTEPDNCKWVTLTYAENMTDTQRLYEDYKNFMKRFRYNYGKCEYIAVVEPQGRGAWHIHLIIIFDYKAPYIPNNDLSRIWGNGFTKTTKLTDVDNVGAYLTAYLTDMELKDGELPPFGSTVKEIELDGQTKRFIKGARLPMYPPGINLYRISRGIKKPEIVQMKEKDFQKVVQDCELTFERSLTLFFEDENSKPLTLYYRYYNRKRKHDQSGTRTRNKTD